MICLVYGPSASGKSAWAERRACELAGQGPRAYLATMRAGGDEARARIEKHLAQRAGKDFVTFETPMLARLQDAALPSDATALLDDIGNLVANEMFGLAEEGACGLTHPEELADRIGAALLAVAKRASNLVVVADAVGEAGWRGDELTRDWIECCGAACCKLAAVADEVVEVRCGMAAWVRGARADAGTTNRLAAGAGKRASATVTGSMGADEDAGAASETATVGTASAASVSLPSVPVVDASVTHASYIYGGNA